MANIAYVRTFYKLLQCQHHLAISKEQMTGHWSKAFQSKNKQLNDFVKPAFPNDAITSVVKQINKNWTNQILAALHSHYDQSIADLKSHIAKFDHNKCQQAIDAALARAKRNFGKKLTLQTIKTFHQICRESVSQKSTAKNAQNASKITEQTSTPPNTESRGKQPSKSKHTVRKLDFTETEAHTPTHSNGDNAYKYNTRSSVKFRNNRATSSTQLPGVYHVHPNVKDKFASWRLNQVSCSTLIVGDSNLKNIKTRTDDVEIQSFPGAKFMHITHLIKSYNHAAYKPENIIVSVGLNDHPNKFRTSAKQLDQLCVALNQKFPKSKIHIAQINCPDNLPCDGTQTIKHLNTYLLGKENVHVIPKLPTEQYELASDNYHWTQFTGTMFLKHWLRCLNN